MRGHRQQRRQRLLGLPVFLLRDLPNRRAGRQSRMVQSEPLRDTRRNRAEAQGPKGPPLLNIRASRFL